MTEEQKAAIRAQAQEAINASDLGRVEARTLLRDLLAALDHCEQDRDKLKFVLSFDEFKSRDKVFDLLVSGDLELTPDRKLRGLQSKLAAAEASLAQLRAAQGRLITLLVRADSMLSLLWHRHVPSDRKDSYLAFDVEQTIGLLRTASKSAALSTPALTEEPQG